MYLRLIMIARFLYTLFDYNVLSEYMDKTLNITHRFSTESSSKMIVTNCIRNSPNSFFVITETAKRKAINNIIQSHLDIITASGYES